jgi:hypothetical protein
VRAADDDAPFSESMLEWLDEGDRMADAPPGVMRPSGAHHALEAPKRRERYFVVGGILVAIALVLTLHFVGGKKPTATAETGEAPAEPAKPSAFAPVTDPSAAPAAPAAPAPVAAEPVAAAVVPPAQAAAAVAVAAPAAAVAPPEPVAALQAAVAPAAAPVPAEAPQVAAAPAPVVPAAAAARPTVAAVAPLAGADSYDAVIGECRAHVAAGRISHALTSCRAALDARPQAPEALTLMAETEFTRGHAGVALKLATSAAEVNQNYADAYVIMGGVYQEKGKNAEALRAILSSLP